MGGVAAGEDVVCSLPPPRFLKFPGFYDLHKAPRDILGLKRHDDLTDIFGKFISLQLRSMTARAM